MREGFLRLRTDERFEVINNDYKYITYLTSGDSLELYDDSNRKWIKGRVEHKWNEGYYFLADDGRNISLYENYKVRI